MKRLLVIVLSLLLLCFCLTACGGDKESGKETSTNSTSQNEIVTNDTENSDVKVEETYKIDDSIDTENSSGVMGTAYIKLPELASMRRGQGQVVDQSNDMLILMGGQHLETTITSNAIEEVLNDFFVQPIDVLSKYRRVDYQNYKFTISDTENVSINDYQMCKYKGEHTFTNNGEDGKMNYVAFVAKLKSNDAYVYWIVLDESIEQNQSKDIDTCATKIAESLHE